MGNKVIKWLDAKGLVNYNSPDQLTYEAGNTLNLVNSNLTLVRVRVEREMYYYFDYWLVLFKLRIR